MDVFQADVVASTQYSGAASQLWWKWLAVPETAAGALWAAHPDAETEKLHRNHGRK